MPPKRAAGAPKHAAKKAKRSNDDDEEEEENAMQATPASAANVVPDSVPVPVEPLNEDDDSVIRLLLSAIYHGLGDKFRQLVARLPEKTLRSHLEDDHDNLFHCLLQRHHSNQAKSDELMIKLIDAIPPQFVSIEALLPCATFDWSEGPVLERLLGLSEDREKLLTRLLTEAVDSGSVKSARTFLSILMQANAKVDSLPRARSFVGSGSSKSLATTPASKPNLNLHYAALTAVDASSLPKTLLNEKAINEGVLDNYWTAVHFACLNPNADILHALLQSKGDLTVDSISESYPIHIAAMAEPSTKNAKGGSSLHLPAETSATLAYLLQLPEDEEVSTQDIWAHDISPLKCAIHAKRPANVVALLTFIKHWNSKNPKNKIERNIEEEIEYAIRTNDPAVLAPLLRDPEAHDVLVEEGLKLLINAFEQGNYSAAVQLIAAGVSPEEPDKLMCAAIDSGSLPLMQLLVESHGVDVNGIAVHESGASFLHYAVEEGFTAGARYLLDKGANALARTGNHVSVLMTATRASRTNCLRLLVERGVDVNATEKQLKEVEQAAVATKKDDNDDDMDATTSAAAAVAVPSGPPFAGMCFVTTGTFKYAGRGTIEDVIKDNGGSISAAVTNKTTHCLLGADGKTMYGQPTGSKSKKYRDSKKKNLTIVDEDFIMKAVRKYQGTGYKGGLVDHATGITEDVIEHEAEESASVLLDMMVHGTKHTTVPQTLKFLLSAGADISLVDSYDRTALHLLVQSSKEADHTVETLELLIEAMIKWNQANPQHFSLVNSHDAAGYSALLRAASMCKWRFVSALLKVPDANVNSIIPAKRTLVPDVVSAESKENEDGADENEDNNDDHDDEDDNSHNDDNDDDDDDDEGLASSAPKPSAAKSRKLAQAEHADDKPEAIKIGMSLLQVLVANNQHALATRVIELGANINYVATTDNDRVPVLLSALEGKLECVLLLLSQKNLEAHCTNKNGQTLLHLVPQYYSVHNVQDALHQILRATDGNFYNGLLIKDKAGLTPLHNACHHTAVSSCARVLVNKGVDINVLDNKGRTPLTIAVETSHLETAIFLVDRGADVNVEVVDKAGIVTTLYELAMSSLVDFADVLLQLPSFDPLNALSKTRHHNASKLIQAAKEYAKLHHQDWDNYVTELLRKTVSDGSSNEIALALASETPKNAFTANDNSLLHLVLERKASKEVKAKPSFKLIAHLLSLSPAPADLLRAKTRTGKTVLHLAAAFGQSDLIAFILLLLREYHVDVKDLINQTDDEGLTPLAEAVHQILASVAVPLHLPSIAWLIRAGADPLATSKSISASKVAASLPEIVGATLLPLLQGLTVKNHQDEAKKSSHSKVKLADLDKSELFFLLDAWLPKNNHIDRGQVEAEYQRSRAAIKHAIVKTPASNSSNFTHVYETAVETVLNAPPKLRKGRYNNGSKKDQDDTLHADVQVDSQCPLANEFTVLFDTVNDRYHDYHMIQEKEAKTNFFRLQLLERKPPAEGAQSKKPMPKYRVYSVAKAVGDRWSSKTNYLDIVDLAAAVANIERQFLEKTGIEIKDLKNEVHASKKFVPLPRFYDLYTPDTKPKEEDDDDDFFDDDDDDNYEDHATKTQHLLNLLFQHPLTSADWATNFDRLQIESGFPTEEQLQQAASLIRQAEEEIIANGDGSSLVALDKSLFDILPRNVQSDNEAGDVLKMIEAVRGIKHWAAWVVARAAINLIHQGKTVSTVDKEAWTNAIQIVLAAPAVPLPRFKKISPSDVFSGEFSRVDEKSLEYAFIKDIYQKPFSSVFRIRRAAEANWSPTENSKLLWHNVEQAEAVSALMFGLQVDPVNVPLKPFGSSIVFSERPNEEVSKLERSIIQYFKQQQAELEEKDNRGRNRHHYRHMYHHTNDDSNQKFATFLCAVNLGSSQESRLRAWDTKPLEHLDFNDGHDSITGLGKYPCTTADSFVLHDGTLVPFYGKTSAQQVNDLLLPERRNLTFSQFAFESNHYAVRDPSRVQLRYLIFN